MPTANPKRQQSVLHNTFVLERSFTKPPELVFASLADPAKMRRWYATDGDSHAVEDFQMDFRHGGVERSRYRFKQNSPFPGVTLSNEGWFQDIVPNQRVVLATTMTLGDRHISSALITFELLATDKGTDLIFTHQAAFFEGADGPEMRLNGWKKLLDLLTAELSR